MDIDLHDYKISVMASKKKSGCGKFLGDALRKKVCSGAIQPCRLCSEMTTNCVGHYGCCETCRLVQVRLKDIKPVVGEIRRMLASQRHKNESQKHATEDKTFVKELQVEDAFAMPTADPEDGRTISLGPHCHMRINVACSYYPHDVHTVSPLLLAKFFSVELSILFKMCNTGANAVVCTVCGANFPTDGKTMSQSVLEHHVSQVHVPHSTARDYRFVCIICDGSAYDLLSVRKHMNERHAELMAEVKTGSTSTYTCSICKDQNKLKSRLIKDKAVQFGTKVQLQLHMTEAHPGNFVCIECSNSMVFTSRDMLDMHTSAYHPEVG